MTETSRNADLVLMDYDKVVEDAWFSVRHGLVVEMREYVEEALRTDEIVPLRNGEFGLRCTIEPDGSFAFSVGHSALLGDGTVKLLIFVLVQAHERPKLFIDASGLQKLWIENEFLNAHGAQSGTVSRVLSEAMYLLPDLHRAIAFAWWDYVRHEDE